MNIIKIALASGLLAASLAAAPVAATASSSFYACDQGSGLQSNGGFCDDALGARGGNIGGNSSRGQ